MTEYVMSIKNGNGLVFKTKSPSLKEAKEFFRKLKKMSKEDKKIWGKNLENPTATFPDEKSGNLFTKTQGSGVPRRVLEVIMQHTTQYDKKRGVGMGEFAIAMSFTNVKNANEIKNTQSDINNFVKKFLNKNNTMEDAKGYHKSLYTAMNADAIAKHFYEQGKADAMKNSVAKAKNVDMNPRQAHGQIEAGGIKVRVLGDDSSDFKFKIKNRK